MPIAITRAVSPSIAQCELTHLERTPIDFAVAVRQHTAYEACLESLRCRITQIPSDGSLPDSVFVEDIALVLDEVAVITRPGAASRRGEAAQVAQALAAYRPLLFIEAPGTLDGGDVLRLGKTLYVGLSQRSSPEGIAQLRRLVQPYEYAVQGVPLTGCLHLKSAVTQVSGDTLLVNPNWVDPGLFGHWRLVDVDPAEPFAANALLLEEGVVYPVAYNLTAARLAQAGLRLHRIDVSELAKAEGGVTCCSLILQA
jgi:dimethylargininase